VLRIVKAHACGNDFLFVREDEAGSVEPAVLARRLCARHTGVGADGLIVYRRTAVGAAMRLLNADGSGAEVSGNGVRCLAAIVVSEAGGAAAALPAPRTPIVISTDAGEKTLTLVGMEGARFVFRAAMGRPTDLRELDLVVDGEPLRVAALAVGNPQCVVLGEPLTEARMRRFGPALERHRVFPAGTNVEFAVVESRDRVRMLIWERGVGPTESSGTGACAAAVAAAAFGGAARDVDVTSPGGTQRVEWRDDGLFLTGWAELVFSGNWLG
jgi:diaminopimelate epimerase